MLGKLLCWFEFHKWGRISDHMGTSDQCQRCFKWYHLGYHENRDIPYIDN